MAKTTLKSACLKKWTVFWNMQFHGNNHKYDIPVMNRPIRCVPLYTHVLDTEMDDKTQTGENIVIGEVGSYHPKWIIKIQEKHIHGTWALVDIPLCGLYTLPKWSSIGTPWPRHRMGRWNLEAIPVRCWCETALALKTSWRCSWCCQLLQDDLWIQQKKWIVGGTRY